MERRELCNIHCAGVIVFNSRSEFVVVLTHRGNYGFPKGKKHRQEDLIDTAIRELQEETGLTRENIELIPSIYFDEVTAKGNVSVRYFLARYRDNYNRDFIFDASELNEVKWMSQEDTISNLVLKNRPQIVRDALKGNRKTVDSLFLLP